MNQHLFIQLTVLLYFDIHLSKLLNRSSNEII